MTAFTSQVCDKFGLTQTDIKTLKQNHFVGVDEDTILIALAVYHNHKVDWRLNLLEMMPFKKRDGERWITTHQIVLGQRWWRHIAQKSGDWMGMKPTEFGERVTRTVTSSYWDSGQKRSKEIEVTFHEWAQVTVLKMVHGEICEFAGARIYWEEFMKPDNPNHTSKPNFFLEKTAELAALRRVFGFDSDADDMVFDKAAASVNEHLANPATSKQGAVDDVAGAVGYVAENEAETPPAPPAKKKRAKKKKSEDVPIPQPDIEPEPEREPGSDDDRDDGDSDDDGEFDDWD